MAVLLSALLRCDACHTLISVIVDATVLSDLAEQQNYCSVVCADKAHADARPETLKPTAVPAKNTLN